MPTYEYECSAGHRYEKRQGFDAPPTQRCAQCRRTARRVLYVPSVVFKGSGFYVTDSRKPAMSEAEGSAPAGESESKVEFTSASPDGDTRTKKETKTDPKKDATTDTKKDAEPAAAG